MTRIRKDGISRRSFIKRSAATSLVLGAAPIFAPHVARAQANTIRIGYVSPQSGSLASFAEADDFVINQVMEATGGQLEIGGTSYSLEILVKDSQSNPNTAAQVARDLIVDDQVDLMLVGSTPETVNPVSTTCEIEAQPLISTMAPWQPVYMGRQADPANPVNFEWTYHYFWGLEDIIANFAAAWSQIQTNMIAGGLFPNDSDGNAWGDPNTGIVPGLAGLGYTVLDPGRYENLNDDFSAQISFFDSNDCNIITGVVIPPDFPTFWNQARQRGLQPSIVTVAKALLFPSSVEALGPAGNNLSTEVWWTTAFPFASSLTGQSAPDLAAAYTESTGRPWTQPLGFAHSLFELALDVLGRSADPKDLDANVEAIRSTDLSTIVGPISWNADGPLGPIGNNVAKTPAVLGQWQTQDDGSFRLAIVENGLAPDVATESDLRPITY